MPAVEKPDLILTIDDDPNNIFILNNFLSKGGFETIAAYDWETALKQAREAQPALILLDVVLPIMDGFELCRKLKADPSTRDIPVIFTTVLTTVKEKIEGFEAGGVDYVTKPFQSMEVIARVRLHIALRKLQAELEEKNQRLEAEIEERVKAEQALREAADKLQRQVVLDPMTEVYNRRHFFEVATRELARARRYGNAISFMLIDVDHFKLVNDKYGHLVGDQVIKIFAKICQESLRQSDVLARYGGEEFVVFLSETGDGKAFQAAERLRQIIENYPFPTDKGHLHITASFGVVVFIGESDVTLDALIDRSDQALYQSKARGRNQVTVWSGGEN